VHGHLAAYSARMPQYQVDIVVDGKRVDDLIALRSLSVEFLFESAAGLHVDQSSAVDSQDSM
jgi:hypothetical protein